MLLSHNSCSVNSVLVKHPPPPPLQALHNTHLLASYAAIDRRVKVLCYVMKVFAKVSVASSPTRSSAAMFSPPLTDSFHPFPSCSFLLPPPDVRHRRRFPWQPVVVRLHAHGALLPAAEEPSCYPGAPRGTNEQALPSEVNVMHGLVLL